MSSGKTLILCFCLLAWGQMTLPAQNPESTELFKKLTDRTPRAADIASKTFTTSSASQKTFRTTEFYDQKNFKSSTYKTTEFSDNKSFKSSTFKTEKAPQQDQAFSSNKSFQSKDFESQAFGDQKKSPTLEERSLPDPTFKPEAKTPNVWKAFEEKLKKDLSMDEVRDLLNKQRQPE